MPKSKSEIKRLNIQAGRPMFEGIESPVNVNDPKNALIVMEMVRKLNEGAKPGLIEAMISSEKMDWQTPALLFNKLNLMYGPFQLDAAATHENTKCRLYYGTHANGSFVDSLTNTWANKTWVNPPYGRGLGKWLKKGAEEARKGATVVMLVPSRTGSKWFQEAVKDATEILFLKGRVVFETSQRKPVLDKHGKPMAAPFDSSVFIFTSKSPGDTGHEPYYKWWDWKK